MLRDLTLRNFRAFKYQSFKFSKINVFVGPNNSGKSSALSAINLISQTINNPSGSDAPLALNGQFDSLGTFLDLVHGNRSNTPMGLDIGFDKYDLKLDYKFRQQRREMELSKFELSENGKQLVAYNLKKDSFELKIKGVDADALTPSLRKRRPIFYQLMLSPYMFSNYVLANRETFSETERDRLMDFERAVSRAGRSLRAVFGRFDSVGPFRDRPHRTYLYSGETSDRIGISGSNTASILSSDASKRGSESRDMTSEISRWFKVAGIAEAVSIKSLTPRHFEIVLQEKGGASHNICDVGFGCSQVLPVLTAALNLFGGFTASGQRGPAPMLVIQEPEIHLHPNAQAALGSFFVGMLMHRGQLFVETHSDNFVLRIARHVADGILKADDVSIFFVHKDGPISKVESIGIAGDGRFDPPFPGGFFPQRQSESLNLAKASFKAQAGLESGREQLEFRYPEEA